MVRPAILSLCSGIGGIDLALRLSVPGARTVCYVEREAYACAVLAARMEAGDLDAAPVWSDLRSFDGGPWRGLVDGITAGYPCQPFSVAGRRRGEQDPRHLWPDIRRILAEVRPRWLFAENVPGHLDLGFAEVLADLASLGFDAAWGVFSAAGSGAPHLRRRLYWLATHGADTDADGDRLHRREDQPESKPRSECATDPGQVGSHSHSDGIGFHESWTVWCGQSHIGIVRTALSHTNGDGFGGIPQPDERAEQPGEQVPRRRDTLPDADGHGLPERQGQPRHAREELASALGAGWWDAEPAVGRVAHGVPARVDRLRALGNAVVPAVAARAFRVLWERLK